jgi:pSer/pThr/pTyr-binding forkhead associated (FHA) protein
MWMLRTTAGLEAGVLTLRLPPGEIKTVGRATRADFILDAPLVSRLHCRLTAGDAGLEITDLGSTNGTFVNDRRVKTAMLATGDQVRVGRVSLLVSQE